MERGLVRWEKMWELIDWNGKAEARDKILIQDSEVYPYFKNIFQSPMTSEHPQITDIEPMFDTYKMHIPILDDLPKMNELVTALGKIGKGIGLDGIPASILRLVPTRIMNIILSLIQNVFIDEYPISWEQLLFRTLPKGGHTYKTPKLRGIAIASIFSR